MEEVAKKAFRGSAVTATAAPADSKSPCRQHAATRLYGSCDRDWCSGPTRHRIAEVAAGGPRDAPDFNAVFPSHRLARVCG